MDLAFYLPAALEHDLETILDITLLALVDFQQRSRCAIKS